MSKSDRQVSARLSALSEEQLNRQIGLTRVLMRKTDIKLEELNKSSRRTGTKIQGLDARQFKATRGSLKHKRRRLERRLRELQDAKKALPQKQSP